MIQSSVGIAASWSAENAGAAWIAEALAVSVDVVDAVVAGAVVVDASVEVAAEVALDVLGAAAAAVDVVAAELELELDFEPLLPQLAIDSAIARTASPGTAVTAKPPTNPFLMFSSQEV